MAFRLLKKYTPLTSAWSAMKSARPTAFTTNLSLANY
jgi:hypothetical protein